MSRLASHSRPRKEVGVGRPLNTEAAEFAVLVIDSFQLAEDFSAGCGAKVRRSRDEQLELNDVHRYGDRSRGRRGPTRSGCGNRDRVSAVDRRSRAVATAASCSRQNEDYQRERRRQTPTAGQEQNQRREQTNNPDSRCL
jgi:hypothetical protein